MKRFAAGFSFVAVLMLADVVATPWIGPEVYPRSDLAVIEIDVLHATRGFWDLGAYSRFGFRHPGPLHAYLLAPLYGLSGGQHLALPAAAWLLNLACLGFVAWAAVRYLPPWPALAMAAAVAALGIRADGLAVSIWNPHAIVFPLAAAIVAASVAAAGHPAFLAAAVAGASFLAQTHVGLVPCAAVLVLLPGIATAVAALRSRRADPDAARRNARGLMIAAVVGVALWIPPLTEQVTGKPGNLTQIVSFFQSPERTSQPVPLAARFAGHAFASVWRPDLELPGGNPLRIARARTWLYWSAGQVLAVCLVAAVAWRRRQRVRCWLGLTVLLTSAVGLAAATRIESPAPDHVLYWFAAVGTLAAGLWIGAVAERLGAWRPARLPAAPDARIWSAAIVLAAAGAATVDLHQVRNRGGDADEGTRAVMAVSGQVGAYLDSHPGGTPLVRLSESNWQEAAGVILQLYKSGRALAIEPDWVVMFGEPLAPRGRETRELFLADETAREIALRKPGSRLIAGTDRLSAVIVDRDPLP